MTMSFCVPTFGSSISSLWLSGLANLSIWDFCAFQTFRAFPIWNFSPPKPAPLPLLSKGYCQAGWTIIVIGIFVCLRLQLNFCSFSWVGDLSTKTGKPFNQPWGSLNPIHLISQQIRLAFSILSEDSSEIFITPLRLTNKRLWTSSWSWQMINVGSVTRCWTAGRRRSPSPSSPSSPSPSQSPSQSPSPSPPSSPSYSPGRMTNVGSVTRCWTAGKRRRTATSSTSGGQQTNVRFRIELDNHQEALDKLARLTVIWIRE